ncbi:MAG: helix-turn-helix domain-containing protein [Oscillospiraceae bacterium]|nr:helix-turn-helix domain-containing protein [Oscillospiraceae bacterium]
MIIAERIRIARKSKGFTQSQLAEKIGVQTAAVSKYEKGLVSPTFEQLQKIAAALEITISVLIGQEMTLALTHMVLIETEYRQKQSEIDEIRANPKATNAELQRCNELIIEVRAYEGLLEKLRKDLSLEDDFFPKKARKRKKA